MSLLSTFANAGFSTASSVIGTTTVAIDGGTAIAAVKNEVRYTKEFEDGGFAPGRSVDLVARTSVFVNSYASAANAYIGKTASVESKTYRVAALDVGTSHVSMRLEHEEDAL